jgi:hypothetical protein
MIYKLLGVMPIPIIMDSGGGGGSDKVKAFIGLLIMINIVFIAIIAFKTVRYYKGDRNKSSSGKTFTNQSLFSYLFYDKYEYMEDDLNMLSISMIIADGMALLIAGGIAIGNLL